VPLPRWAFVWQGHGKPTVRPARRDSATWWAEFSLARPSLTALSSDAVSELIFGHEKTVERLLVDREAHTYFGYTLAAETVAGTRTIRVTLAPLSGNGEEQLRALTDHPDAWQLLCPGCPAPSELKAIAPNRASFRPPRR